MTAYEWFLDQLKTNQFMSGAIGGSISFTILNYFKSYIMFIVNIIKNFFVRDIVLLSAKDITYYNSFNKYTSQFIKHPKNIKIGRHTHFEFAPPDSNGTSNGYAVTKYQHQAGYGSHWFWYNWYTFVRVLISLDTDNHTDTKTETISIFFAGLRPRAMRNKFYEEFSKWEKVEKNRPTYFKFNDYGNLHKVKEIKHRPLESVFINELDLKRVDEAVRTVGEFDKKFEKLGRSKSLGILLEGPPGTGKSSLIQALASKYKKDIHFVDFGSKLSGIANILQGVAGLQPNSFIVLEDIDCHECTHKRGSEASKSSDLASILRMLDGVDMPDNSIVFATTNNLEILDEALTRPGRFDLCIHMGLADKCIAQKMIEYVDESKMYLLDELEFPIAHAALQAKILGR